MDDRSQTLGVQLARMSEDGLQGWAKEVLEELTPAHVLALDEMGWKITRKDNNEELWPRMAKCPPANVRSQDAVEDWAGDLMFEVSDECTKALDIMGWQIVEKDNPDSKRWPFNSEDTDCECPDWCSEE